MEKKKIYIFFSSGLCGIGGCELYMAGKANYLKKFGWKIYACTAEISTGRAVVPELNEYIERGCGWTFLLQPPYKLKKYEQEQILNFMIQKLELEDFNNFEIIIETHFSLLSFWGELLAERVKGRHFVANCTETYRGNVPYFYDENLDYFYFKWKRNEIICSKESCALLFNGYKNITAPLYDMPPDTIHEQSPIQDVDFPIDKIQKLDWNICHIGRISKYYVPHVMKGVAELARRHPDKNINLIFVGDVTPLKNFIMNTFENIDNVQLTALGDMVPIPRVLFSKIDVVCAISQSARFAANEGILTIVANAKNPEKTSGVLGYDTEEQVNGEGTFSYFEALENVLVKRLYDDKEYSLPKLKPDEEYYKKFWTILENAAPTKEYYSEKLSEERIRNWTAIFPFGTISRGARVILFGATEIAKDYKIQILTQSNSQIEIGEDYIKNFVPKPYCKIVATIDEHPENFDDAVEGVERLKQKDYDAIIITTFQNQAQAVYNKIVQTVPDMANRIIYYFKILQT